MLNTANEKMQDEIGANIRPYFISISFSFTVFSRRIWHERNFAEDRNESTVWIFVSGWVPPFSIFGSLINVATSDQRSEIGQFLLFCNWHSAVDEKYTDKIQRIIHRFYVKRVSNDTTQPAQGFGPVANRITETLVINWATNDVLQPGLCLIPKYSIYELISSNYATLGLHLAINMFRLIPVLLK